MALLTVSGLVFLLFFLALLGFSECRNFNDVLRFPSQSASFVGKEEDDPIGTRWAVLIAGSSGYGNYRHQADVCHSYQIMKRGGLKDENIIVFMYDDIAYHEDNPRPGVIINNPYGENVYAGVPKDYVGVDVTVDNFFAVLLGNKSSLKGGSGKVVNSGPNDHIFIFYSDHGGPGVLGMPTYPYLYANDLVDVLKRKHSSKSYKSMVFYLEACESGSIFEGLLPENLNIYATTAANAQENSWGTYCPGQFPSPPPEYDTCLGDMYSVSWMEDSDVHNLRTEKLKQQYHLVKSRTANLNAHGYSSHVMQYGNIDLSDQALFLYMGTNPANENSSFIVENRLPPFLSAMNQRDADLLYLWRKFQKFPEGSNEKRQAEKQLLDVISLRVHVDSGMELIGSLLFGPKGKQILGTVQPSGKPLVNNWDCLKAMVRTFETYCGSLSQDGMKHMRSFANICNAGVQVKTMAKVASQACRSIPSTSWSSISKGFSA